MTLKETNKALNNFAKYVIQQSRTNLTKGGEYGTYNASGKLYESLGYDLKTHPNSFSLAFFMENYGEFKDRGVRGIKGGKSYSNFSYKTSSNLIGLEYNTGVFSKWAKLRKKQVRDKKGRFLSYKQSGYALANIIKNYGIKPSLFFTKPFEKAFDRLPDELVEKFALDLEQFLETTT